MAQQELKNRHHPNVASTSANPRRKRRLSNSRHETSLTASVKQQFDELVHTFEALIDGQIPLKNQASKLKDKVEAERKKLTHLIKKRQKKVSRQFQSKTLKFRVNVQKSLRTAITGDPNRSIRRHIREPPQIKFIDKMSFTVSMLTLIVSEFFLLCHPSSFKYLYALMLVPLMIVRYIDYKDKKYHYFLFDFCYFINFVTITHIFFFPNSTWLFETLFVLSNGPVLLAIMVWRNSMVLHSVDKMTSLFIHAFPPFYTYCNRWLDHDRVRIQSTELSLAAQLFYPTIMYLMWQFAYLFKTEVVSKSYLEENSDVETALRWLARDSKNATNKLGRRACVMLGIMGKDEKFDSTSWKTKCIFVTLNLLYFLITILPTGFMFKNREVQLTVMLTAMFCSVWQAANYYIEVFSERYHDELERKQKQLEEKYLYIDENLDSLLNDNWRKIPDNASDVSDIDQDYDTSDDNSIYAHAHDDGKNETES